MAGLFGALMIAMTIAGVAYAHWTEYLVIHGEFTMGRMDIAESLYVKFGNENDKSDWPDYWEHVAKATITPVASQDGIVREISVDITNAYPKLRGLLVVDYHNVGTVPAKLVDMKLKYQSRYFEYVDVCWWSDDEYAARPGQLDPCHTGYLIIEYQLNNKVEEETTYTLSLETKWYNWNEPDVDPVQLCWADTYPCEWDGYYLYTSFVPDQYGYIPVK